MFDEAATLDKPVLGYGLGRSYGDSNQNPDGILFNGRSLDKFIQFDRETGILRAEAGVSLAEVLEIAVPAGFFLPTTPGSRFVTLGGAIANDVHGKNHHRAGCFSAGVRRFGLWRSDEGLLEVSRQHRPELFAATVGGLGLSGLIVWCEIQLVPIGSSFIAEESRMFGNVDEFFDQIAEDGDRFEHTVSWIDCTASGPSLGRGMFSGGNWADDGEYTVHSDRGPALPFDLPSFALNPLTLKSFNTLYYERQKLKPRQTRSHYSGFFYPLDTIRGWNRLYGHKGFFQYQSVVPMEQARQATREMLARVAQSGQGSMLAVLKTFGGQDSEGLLSFPHGGATLALDFKNTGRKTLDLLADLDSIVASAGGRLYPAKDGRISAEMFQAGYPQWEAVEALRDPSISSSFWSRVSGSVS